MIESSQMASALVTERRVLRAAGDRLDALNDAIAVEEPLEIRLAGVLQGERFQKSVAITMRSPGNDLELAAGFLFTEGLIRSADQIRSLGPCGPATAEGLQNVVRVDLGDDLPTDLARLERNFYTTSSCGVCGKASIEALMVAEAQSVGDGPAYPTELIHRLPDTARAGQEAFDRTGGLHAAALIDAGGQLIGLREDVGRHNALDKLIGAELLANRLPLGGIVFVSGRASFELVQKAVMAGAPVLAAVGAPSSLAIDLAARFNLTLIGFLRQGRFTIYTGAERIERAHGR